MIHFERLKDQFATHFVPFSQFETDAANGELPDFSFIEPCLIIGHNDYHPAFGRAMGHGVVVARHRTRRRRSSAAKSSSHGSTPPTGGCRARRAPTCGTRRCSSAGTSRAERMTMSRRPRCRVRMRRPRPASSASRSTGPATESPRSSCRRGSPKARCSTRSTATRRSSPRCASNGTWGTRSPHATRPPEPSPTSSPSTPHATPRHGLYPKARPVPPMQQDMAALGAVVSVDRQTLLHGIREYAAEHNLEIEGLPKDPKADIPDDQVVNAHPRVPRELVPAAREQKAHRAASERIESGGSHARVVR